MLSDLEKYLKKNRPLLDVEKPDDQAIWEGIRNELPQDKPSKANGSRWRALRQVRKLAAILIIALSLGYVLYDLVLPALSGNYQPSLSKLDPELGKREQEYQSLVRLKQEELQSYSFIENFIIAELIEEINRLDTIYDQAMKDLGELGYNEQIIHTIFDTYEKKIQLLELIILETNKTQTNGTTDQNLL